MTTSFTTPAATERLKAAKAAGLEPADLINAFRLMYTSRRIDDREIVLKRQQKIFFQISGAGHEAIQIAAGLVTRPGYDWYYPYYRDRALALALGVTPLEMLLHAVGAGEDPFSGGRQMPNHWACPAKNIVAPSSATGTQYVQAVGCADANRILHPGEDRLVLVSSGEGATSEGEFWESINQACLYRLPVVFLIEDNGWAISVPVEAQTPGGSISKLMAGFPDLLTIEVDGTDLTSSFRAMGAAAAWCREGHGPSLVHAHCVRPYSHSLSDDERNYKTKHEREEEAQRDPLLVLSRFLVEEGVVDKAELEHIRREIDHTVLEAAHTALKADPPSPDSAMRNLYSETVDPTSAQFDVPAHPEGEPKLMSDLINATLKEEMRRNDRIVVFGEDVADCSREGNLSQVKGKGGVFLLTAGIQSEFGSRRCFNTPIAEASIVGRAIGMATAGLRPVAEIQFFDYIWPAMMQLRDELASLRWRSNGLFSAPLVIRVPIGGYLTGGAIYHSQSGEVIFTHIPGLRVVFPSNAEDACGLLRTALRSDDPVLFLEHKKLYREMYNRAPHPGPDFTIPFGKAKIVKPGESLTIVTYGALVQKSVLAAQEIEKRRPDVSIEIVDLRTLSPWDWEAVKASVIKTSRVIITHEDTLSFGYGAEIAARIADELFAHLDAPVKRVAAMDTWVGYHPQLEAKILPQTDDLIQAIDQTLSY
ncbi:MAG TPA: dehydrogenase E1 component subunit alpha/beta [Bryobacteraceae bacterium]|jgi:2-oxoisovalerate dehydrogenase E1 component|nr:dehydrogenase E1 component subunit alpha/beta [Bryobacteraceae bacterium]